MCLCILAYGNAGARLVQKYSTGGGRTLNLHFDKMVLRYDAVGNVERACGEQTLCSRLWMVLILSYATDCHCNVAFVKCYILSAPFLKFEATLSLCMPNIL